MTISIAGIAHADPVTFQTATTLGCFSTAACNPSSSSTSTTDLSFLGSAFGPLVSSGGNLTINLGSFTLTDSQTAWIDKDFTGLVTFTLPTVIAPGSQTKFTAEVDGLVLKNLAGIVYIDFDNNPLHFTFQNAQYTGSFDFAVNDLLFGALGYGGSSTVNWTGSITNAQQTAIGSASVPEPSSMMMLGAGVLGFFGVMRKKFAK